MWSEMQASRQQELILFNLLRKAYAQNNGTKCTVNKCCSGRTWRQWCLVKCQIEKGKYSMQSLIHGVWKMKQTSECNQREADSQI